MGEVFCKERPSTQDAKEYIQSLAKKYQVEKLLDRSKIIIKKESEFKTVDRIIARFRHKSVAEFDTLFKLYKLQKYIIDEKYFKGTQYKLHTLNMLKTLVRASTLDDTIPCNNSYKNIINEFIKQVKPISKPFSSNYFDKKRLRIDDLVSCGSLTKEEIDFINSEIHPIYIRKHKQESLPVITKEIDMIKTPPTKKVRLGSEERFKILVENSSLSVEGILKLIPSLSKKSISCYKSYLNLLNESKGERVPSHCPPGLVTAWLEFSTKPNAKLSLIPDLDLPAKKDSDHSDAKQGYAHDKKPRKHIDFRYSFTEEDLKNIVLNVDNPHKIYELIPLGSKKTIDNFIHQVRYYKLTGEKHRWMPNKMWTVCQKMLSKTTDIEATCTITDSEKSNRNCVQGKYTLLHNGIPVISSDSEDYIKGYMDAIVGSFKIHHSV